MTTRNYQGRKYHFGTVEKTDDSLTVEGALQININEEPFTITMRTPGNDDSLIRGLLHSEGVINNVNFTPEITFADEEEKGMIVANVTVPASELAEGFSNSRNLLSVASCGVCGKTELEDLSYKQLVDHVQIHPETLDQMFVQMEPFQKAFKESGGSHAAAAFDENGKMIYALEDIGRHNAVDKVIGKLILTNDYKKAVCMTVSGRISYEIVVKCFKARIPILAAVSAPSSLAVDFAKELGITLLAFCRNNRSTCYANTHRIKNHNLKNQAG